METTKSVFEKKNISSERVVSLISELLGKQGYPDPDNPQPAGPWDPYIRKAVERVQIFGPRPEPWRLSYFAHLHPEMWDAVHPHSLAELNPQPLPPGSVFVASITQEVIDRALLMQDVADAMNQTVNERSIIIVSGLFGRYIDEFDELCPRLIVFLKHPPKGGGDPPPHPEWVNKRFSARDLFTAAAVFHQNSLSVVNQSLGQALQHAGVKLAELGMARM
jgi:hypothetical protein